MTPSRRDMLRVGLSGLGAISIGGSLPAFVSKFAYGAPAANPDVSNDNVLVIVQLSGGNDGLNTIVPVRDDLYFKSRPRLGLKEGLHRLDDDFALNRGMKAFKKLYDEGRLAVLNGCGYPQPSRSHFRSMEIWHTANPADHQLRGWLGHYLDHALRGTEGMLKAVNVGSELPQALVTDGPPVPTIQSINDFQVRTDNSTSFDAKLEREIIEEFNAVRDASPAMQFLSRQATNAIIESRHIQKMTAAYKPDVQYPRGLGGALQLIAQIISGNFGTKIFYCQIGGFDTHANQMQGHENLLRQVSDSIAAFHADLDAKGLGDKVTVMCFSEFGRRVAENSSNGTDHGAAGPMFVSGPKVKGGLYGGHPSLEDLDSGDLKYTTDFRRIYATLLDEWLNVDSAKVLKNKFEPVKFL